MIKTIFSILLIGSLAGWQNEWQNPKTTLVEAFHPEIKERPALFVQHKINGRNLLIECIVTGITFRQSDYTKQKVGKMVVWLDGKRNSEVDTAAFIMKGLKPGSHRIKLEVVNLNNEPYGLEKEFMVNIPK